MSGQQSKEKILAAAARLFQGKGYAATGLDDIIAESGAPKGSLYYYFPKGKLQLAIEAVRYAGGRINGEVRLTITDEKDPARAFQRVLSDIATHFKEEGRAFYNVSLSIIALESSVESAELRQACQEVYDERGRLFAEKLESSGCSKAEARRLSSIFQSMIEGAIVTAQTRHEVSALLEIRKYVPILLSSARKSE